MQNKRKRREGIVLKNSGSKSLSVVVQGMKAHPAYGKVMKLSVKYMVHDEKEEAAIGDRVTIEESRPISKTKKWRLIGVIK